ncbi:MAG: PAS domain-containing protein, partial [Ruminococcus sp.]|nr:PAS domain-containing protein [Ruminococcus sp.]
MTEKIFKSIVGTSVITAVVTLILVNVLDSDNIVVQSGIFITAVLVAIIFGLRRAKKITRPLIEVNPDDPKINYSEINPLIRKIRSQKGKISRQKHEVRSGREQLSLITENMNEGIVIADVRNNILSCNSGALKLLGVENVGEGQSIYLLN